tara:strand:- start:181 stop:405 length:225 start_codon:yes stop_codon:yes gene_type:complete
MISCKLCNKETVFIYNFCTTCEYIKRVVNIYGAEEVKGILERVCIRNTEQRNYKISSELKKDIEKKHKKINIDV